MTNRRDRICQSKRDQTGTLNSNVMKPRLLLTPRFSEVAIARAVRKPLQRFLGVVVLLLLPQLGFAATNDLGTLLQKGLFEEEANHNFKAATDAYQAVINRFDED